MNKRDLDFISLILRHQYFLKNRTPSIPSRGIDQSIDKLFESEPYPHHSKFHFLDENPIKQFRQLLNMAINLLIRIHTNEERNLFYLENMFRITTVQTCWTEKISNFCGEIN